jgi:hypothetical protein
METSNSARNPLPSGFKALPATDEEENPFDFEGHGQVTQEYEELYRIWGDGQIGIIGLGNVPIHREALEAKRNMIIDKDNVCVSKHCQLQNGELI